MIAFDSFLKMTNRSHPSRLDHAGLFFLTRGFTPKNDRNPFRSRGSECILKDVVAFPAIEVAIARSLQSDENRSGIAKYINKFIVLI